jgi:hypothetical protein
VAQPSAGLKAPQGVGFVAGVLAVASAGDGTVRLYRGADFAPAGRIDLGDDADNVRVDPSGLFWVGYGKGGLALIDPTKATRLRDIKLPAHPEGFQRDAATGRAYVNLPDAHAIAVVDTTAGSLLTLWRQKDGANFPMAIEAGGKRLASVFRSPPRLAVLDAGSGAVIAAAETCGDADDVFFDGKRQRLYVSCGEGAVDIFDSAAPGLPRIGHVATRSGARTSLFIPELDRLIVAARAGLLGGQAQLLVLKPDA